MNIQQGRNRVFDLYRNEDLTTFFNKSLIILNNITPRNAFEKFDIQMQIDNVEFALIYPDNKYYTQEEIFSDLMFSLDECAKI